MPSSITTYFTGIVILYICIYLCVYLFFLFCFSRPGLLNASDPSYPWLADSWPATSLPVNNSTSGPNDLGNFGRGGKFPFIESPDIIK